MTNMKGLLRTAREEIIRLRHSNEILGAKVEMIDLFACVLHTQPLVPTQGYGEDIAWALQKKIDEINAEEPDPVLGAAVEVTARRAMKEG